MINVSPTKPIQKATVFFSGDCSVGIPSVTFDLEMYFDPSNYSEQGVKEGLNEIRESIKDTYELILGDERPQVMFDFEMLAEQAAEHYMEEENADIGEAMKDYERKSRVHCPHCLEAFNSKEVKFVNIESDIQGRDEMTFICPLCEREQKSLVFVR
jgi:hypothetical protein